jgi:hypothetical protein
MFEHVPTLTELARQIDPMLRSVDEVLQHRVSQTIESITESRGARAASTSPLNRHRNCIVETLTELVGQ